MSKYHPPPRGGPPPGPSHSHGDYQHRRPQPYPHEPPDSMSRNPNHRSYPREREPPLTHYQQRDDPTARPSVFDRLGSKRSNKSPPDPRKVRHGHGPSRSPPQEFYAHHPKEHLHAQSRSRSRTPRFQHQSRRTTSPPILRTPKPRTKSSISPDHQDLSRKPDYRTNKMYTNGKKYSKHSRHRSGSRSGSGGSPPLMSPNPKIRTSRPHQKVSPPSSSSRGSSSSKSIQQKSKPRLRPNSVSPSTSESESSSSGSESGDDDDSDDSSVPSVKLRTTPKKPKKSKGKKKKPKKSQNSSRKPKPKLKTSPLTSSPDSTNPNPREKAKVVPGSGPSRHHRERVRDRDELTPPQILQSSRKRRLSEDSGEDRRIGKRSRSYRSPSNHSGPTRNPPRDRGGDRLRMINVRPSPRRSHSPPPRRDNRDQGFRGHGQKQSRSPPPPVTRGGYHPQQQLRNTQRPTSNSAGQRLAPRRPTGDFESSMSKRPGPSPLLPFVQSKQSTGGQYYKIPAPCLPTKRPTPNPSTGPLILKTKEALLEKYEESFNHKKSRVDQWVDQTLPPVISKSTGTKAPIPSERPALLPTPKTVAISKQIPSLLGLPLISRSSLKLPCPSPSINPKKTLGSSYQNQKPAPIPVSVEPQVKEKEHRNPPAASAPVTATSPPEEKEPVPAVDLEENLSEISEDLNIEEDLGATAPVVVSTTTAPIESAAPASPDAIQKAKSSIGDDDFLDLEDFEEISDEELTTLAAGDRDKKIGIADALGIDWSVLVCRKKVELSPEALDETQAAEKAQIKERWTLPSIFKRIGVPRGLLSDELFGKIVEKVDKMESRFGIPESERTSKEELINPVRRWKRLERKSAIEKYALGPATRALSSQREQTYRRYLMDEN